ncbi:MAG: hypothetical protein ACREIF_05730 [Chthoniobacterales bacterium]
MKTKLASGSYRLVVMLGTIMSLSFGVSAARGDLSFSDSFQYLAGPLDGQGPPPGAPAGQTGWATQTGNPQIVPLGLTYGRIFAAGGSTSFSGTNFDYATANLSPVNSGVVSIGFLFQLTSGSDSTGYAVLNAGGFTSSQPGFGLIFGTGLLGIDNGTGGAGISLTGIAPSATAQWLVVELDFTAGSEALFVNPDFQSEEAGRAGQDVVGLQGRRRQQTLSRRRNE